MSDSRGHDQRGPGLSRRQFLKGSGVAAATTALTGTPVFSATVDDKAGDVAGFGPDPVQLQLTVNGRPMETKIEPRVTLLDALRNHLDVTGCKRVCDRGTCGACTVILDGKSVYSCTTLALEARGRDVRTAESLGQAEKLDAVPAAFVEFDAQQCGFCTPGFIMAMRAALDKNPKATQEEVERGVCGNICRCGTYEQMRQAVASLCAGAGKGG